MRWRISERGPAQIVGGFLNRPVVVQPTSDVPVIRGAPGSGLCSSERMDSNDDGRTVAAMDTLAPGIGEIIGGSQREERLEV